MTTEKAEPDTLLPCPLCQAEAQTLLRGFYYRHDPDLEEPSKRSAVLCPTCNCRAPLASWNTRAAPPRCDAQSEALRKARQYVADAGSDEDSETQANSAALLAEIDDCLIPATAKPAQGDAQGVRDFWHIEPSTPEDGFECYYLMREGKQVAEICGRQSDERARHLDDLVFAANGNTPDIVSAWSIVEKWLAAYAEEEQLFSRFADNVMLGGIMSAKQRRAISAALAEAKPAQGDAPRVADDDKGAIAVTFNGHELRGWSYASEGERRTKMLAAREYVEGWCDGRKVR